MFDFLFDFSKFDLEITGMLILGLGFGIIVTSIINLIINYYIKDFEQKNMEHPPIIRFINSYVFGLLISLLSGFIFSHLASDINKLNTFLSVSIVTALILGFKVMKRRLFKS